MKKRILLLILTIGILNATEYRVAHLKKGKFLNVREEPIVNSRTLIGRLPSNTIGIEIRECKYAENGREWCYVRHGVGRKHLEGWVSRSFLEPMSKASISSDFYIKNFLVNYYKADEENFLDKLKVFYIFPMQQYMYQKGVNRMNLRASKVNFYKKWPQRYYTLGYMKVLKRKEDYTDVKVTVHWKFVNGSESESGRDVHKLRLVHEDNQFKVLAIKKLQHHVYPKVEEIEESEANLSDNTLVENQEGGIKEEGTTTISSGGYYIKAGSFLEEPSSSYLNKITTAGYQYVIDKANQGGKIIKRVYIGPFPTTAITMEALEKVRRDVNKNAYIQTRIK